jgi:hypothetical protein
MTTLFAVAEIEAAPGATTTEVPAVRSPSTFWPPGWPRPRGYPERERLLCILKEEWEHRQYAERNLNALEARR